MHTIQSAPRANMATNACRSWIQARMLAPDRPSPSAAVVACTKGIKRTSSSPPAAERPVKPTREKCARRWNAGSWANSNKMRKRPSPRKWIPLTWCVFGKNSRPHKQFPDQLKRSEQGQKHISRSQSQVINYNSVEYKEATNGWLDGR